MQISLLHYQVLCVILAPKQRKMLPKGGEKIMTKIKERPEGFIVPIASDVGLKGALKTQDEFF